MSSAAAAAAVHPHTYWCHECDMSVYLLPPSNPSPTSPRRCPHCRSDFLEQMDSFTPHLPLNPDSTPDPSLFSFPDSINVDPSTAFTPSDDNFLLDSPYLHRLIHHLTHNDSYVTALAATNRHSSPASKSAVGSLQDLKIDADILDKDPIILCPVCKDQFLLDMEVKTMPCKHMYHADCILPWLEMNNTCPVCRFKLPTQEEENCEEVGLRNGENFVGAMRLEELVDDDEDFLGFGSALRQVSRRQYGRDLQEQYRRRRMLTASRLRMRRTRTSNGNGSGSESEGFLFSPTQIGEAGAEVGVVERTDSAETVSSWPVEASGGEAEAGISNSRVSGDGEAAVVL